MGRMHHYREGVIWISEQLHLDVFMFKSLFFFSP